MWKKLTCGKRRLRSTPRAVVESVEPFDPMMTSYSRPRPSRKASNRSVLSTRIASSLYTGMPTVKGVGVAGLMRAGSDDVRVAVGDVPVGDVAEKGLLGRRAAAAEVPPAGVQGARDAHEAEGAEMPLVPRGEQRGQEGGPALGHMALGKAQDLARHLVVHERAGKEVDDGAEGEVEERQHAQHDVALEAAVDQHLEWLVAERRHGREAPAEEGRVAHLDEAREPRVARPELVEAPVEGGERADDRAAGRPRTRGHRAVERVAGGAERAREGRPADVPLEHVPAADRLHPGRELVHVEPAQLAHETGAGGRVGEAPHDRHAALLER